MIIDFKKFQAEVKEKLGGMTSRQWIDQHHGEHLWAYFGEYQSCAFCGIIKAKEGREQKPCKGIVKIGLRDPVKRKA